MAAVLSTKVHGVAALEKLHSPFAGAAAKVGAECIGVAWKVRLDVPPGQLIVKFPIRVIVDGVVLASATRIVISPGCVARAAVTGGRHDEKFSSVTDLSSKLRFSSQRFPNRAACPAETIASSDTKACRSDSGATASQVDT